MHLDHLLLALLILLVISAASVALSRRLGLGAILGLLMAGILIGPSGLGLPRRVNEIREVSELGIVFLLFLVGLKMQPHRLWALRRLVFGLGSAQVVVTGLALASYIGFLGRPWNVALLLGLGLALSSTAFVLPMLEERGQMAAPHGRATFGILLLQDLAIVPLLALMPLLGGKEGAAGNGTLLQDTAIVATALAGVYVLGRWVVPAVLRRLAERGNTEAFAMTAVAVVIGAAWAMLRAGLSMALGAFMVGLLLSDSPYRQRIEAIVEPFKGVLLGLFFIAIGMGIDVGLLPQVGARLVVHVVVLIAIKIVVVGVLCVAFGLSGADSSRCALLLGQAGEFGFVLFGAALAAGILPPEGFALAAMVISASMAATPVLGALADRIGARTPLA
jgi:glutathione-regulated potassium-efflux system ancillary protein KefC